MLEKICTVFLAGFLVTGFTACNKEDVTTETTKSPVAESGKVIKYEKNNTKSKGWV